MSDLNSLLLEEGAAQFKRQRIQIKMIEEVLSFTNAFLGVWTGKTKRDDEGCKHIQSQIENGEIDQKNLILSIAASAMVTIDDVLQLKDPKPENVRQMILANIELARANSRQDKADRDKNKDEKQEGATCESATE